VKNKKNKAWEIAETIITAVVLALLIRAFIIQAFKIPSGSMIPTLLIGDHVLVNKFIYGVKIPFTDNRILVFKKPGKGDIIVFKFPKDASKDFIKRVMAVEGDKIESKNKVIFINDKPVNEAYSHYSDNNVMPQAINPRDNFGPFTVPEGKYFVMGDNRDQSNDSRYWGYVDFKDVKGKALILYWSWDNSKNWVRFNRIGRLIH
jgi:signal peptidase I